MSSTYTYKGYTIDHLGGGYYRVGLPGAENFEQIRGKDSAEAHVDQLVAAAGAGPAVGAEQEGQLEQQPDLATALAQAQAQAQSGSEPQPDAPTVTTVKVTEGVTPSRIPTGEIPNRFTGTMAPEQIETLKRMGVETTRIILEESESIPPTGLFISHNFRPYMIVPGEPVDVPNFVLGVLDDAVMSSPIVDNNTKKVLGYRKRSKYPYRRV